MRKGQTSSGRKAGKGAKRTGMISVRDNATDEITAATAASNVTPSMGCAATSGMKCEGCGASAPCAQLWTVDNLSPDATSISASRRTDIPAFYGPWFSNRLDDGFAEYIIEGNRYRCSLRPVDVLYFCFWSKNPRPFLRVLRRVREIGFPALFHVTITGLGGTAIEPFVPPADKVVATVRELASMLPPKALAWRYDPVFMSNLCGIDHHLETFRRLSGELAAHVDRIAVSFVSGYERRVKPDLQRYHEETGEQWQELPLAQQEDLVGQLDAIAKATGSQLTVCGSPKLQQATDFPTSDCNSVAWARRVYPELEQARSLKMHPTREGCKCSEEHDIGCFDSCVHGCRYSYGSSSYQCAFRNFKKHDPQGACIIPANSLPLVEANAHSCRGCHRGKCRLTQRSKNGTSRNMPGRKNG